MTENDSKIKILIICKGNICRSPLAEAILNKKLFTRGLNHHVILKSAAIKDYHIGKGADPNAILVGKNNNYDLSKHIVRLADFNNVSWADLIVVMDKENRADLLELFGPEVLEKTQLLMSFIDGKEKDVIDPFKKSYDEFHKAFTMVETACESLLDFVTKKVNRNKQTY